MSGHYENPVSVIKDHLNPASNVVGVGCWVKSQLTHGTVYHYYYFHKTAWIHVVIVYAFVEIRPCQRLPLNSFLKV